MTRIETMTEEEWLASTDPAPMLQCLREQQVSERKMRLLACACCRSIWDYLPDPRSRQAVEVAERFADDQATWKELAWARSLALAASERGTDGPWAAYWAMNIKPGAEPLDKFFDAASAAPARNAARLAGGRQPHTWNTVQAISVRKQVALIREVIGNPFRPAWTDPRWLGWEGGLVTHLASGIYEERAFDQLPFLGDALEEAGCTQEAILEHCREPGLHVRGCWVLDLLLGRS